MSKFTKEMVNEYADKLLIGLTEEENKMVLDEFDVIDKNISVVSQIPNLENVEVMSYCLDEVIYELRSDDEVRNVDREIVLSNCEDKVSGRVRVPKVVK